MSQIGIRGQRVDPRIESLQSDDWTTGSALRVVGKTVEVLVRRAALEVADINAAIRRVKPDVVLVDANCWGAMSTLETQRTIPWLVFSPFIPYLDSPGSPPFGPGAPPRAGWVGRVRDLGIRMVTSSIFDRPFRDGINPVRAALRLPPVHSADDLMRRAPGVLVATGKPFEYVHTEWGGSVHMIGPAIFELPSAGPPGWLDDIELPVVLVTTSSVRQADAVLVRTALRALDGEPVHVVATHPAGAVDFDASAYRHATLSGFVPHTAVLDRAVCVVTHGGMGVTQKALSRGIPVCAVPFARDQFEVARRVEVARCGTRLPARRLNVRRLRDKRLVRDDDVCRCGCSRCRVRRHRRYASRCGRSRTAPWSGRSAAVIVAGSQRCGVITTATTPLERGNHGARSAPFQQGNTARQRRKLLGGNTLECSVFRKTRVRWRYDVGRQSNTRTPRKRGLGHHEIGCSAIVNGGVPAKSTPGHRVSGAIQKTNHDNRIGDDRVSDWHMSSGLLRFRRQSPPPPKPRHSLKADGAGPS